MNKQTKGCWKAVSKELMSGETVWDIIDENGKNIVGAEGFYRCDGSDESNAKLAAGAPKLLETLNQVIESWKHGLKPEENVDVFNKAVNILNELGYDK